jgi:hypothetical protein
MCAPSGLALGSVRYFVLLVPPKVVGCTQITSDGLAKGFMVTDGVRLYFSEVSGGHYVLSQVSTAGGETVEIPTPRNIMVQDISKDHSQLLAAQLKALTMKQSCGRFAALRLSTPSWKLSRLFRCLVA